MQWSLGSSYNDVHHNTLGITDADELKYAVFMCKYLCCIGFLMSPSRLFEEMNLSSSTYTVLQHVSGPKPRGEGSRLCKNRTVSSLFAPRVQHALYRVFVLDTQPHMGAVASFVIIRLSSKCSCDGYGHEMSLLVPCQSVILSVQSLRSQVFPIVDGCFSGSIDVSRMIGGSLFEDRRRISYLVRPRHAMLVSHLI